MWHKPQVWFAIGFFAMCDQLNLPYPQNIWMHGMTVRRNAPNFYLIAI